MKYQFNPAFPDATNEHKWEQIRNWRRIELGSTDWTQLPDAPVDATAWAVYRQELRDLPATYALADDVELPIRPPSP